jgi:hypothetical protein
MRVVVRGWTRDCGEKVIMETDELADMPVSSENRLKRGETYLEVNRAPRVGGRDLSARTKVHVWADVKLNLNGSYQTHFEILGLEIARLFYLAYGHRGLDDIARLLASFQEDEKIRAAAVTVSKEDARKAIVAQWLLLPAAERANHVQAYDFAKQALGRYNWRTSAGAYGDAVDWIRPHVGQP